MPTAAIGADVMAGFPGETESEFAETRRMIEDLPFTYLHVFTFSARPGTAAAVMSDQVPVHVARERNRILRELAAEKKLAFMRSFVGREVEAITLGSGGGGETQGRATSGRARLAVVPTNSLPREFGTAESRALPVRAQHTKALTDNYLKLRLRGTHEPNRWLKVSIHGVKDEALVGDAA
jgi:tRNA A37 methylthiotransferase MiaB